ncbi:MAG TPA: glycosyltransferase [Acidisoma sp.]|uniref:glycosyltransferase family 2 protein n=1 Tax=Acidisoma sp. TaxID=1872115 RepID=UPI002C5A7711|nr:glycosyltransferase [Acidisoma sp.]HTI03067.1 glycosyltransferase [Acidisoma sp.]
MKIVIGIATINRPVVLRQMLENLLLQIRAPDHIVICGSKPADTEGIKSAFPSIDLIYANAGASAQRNAIIRASVDADVILFLDDDFFPQQDYILALERHMAEHPKTVVATGRVIADGINGPGLSVRDAMALLAADWSQYRDRPAANGQSTEFSGYGCNMAVRMAEIRRARLAFDEALPLYSWQEDVDLSRRLAVFGNVVKLDAARGVHLGVKSGRGSGVKLGYSQVANPLYLVSKRAGYPLGRAAGHISKNIAKNLVRSAWPEPYVDRRGRLLGNLFAIWDLCNGRMSPQRVLDL